MTEQDIDRTGTGTPAAGQSTGLRWGILGPAGVAKSFTADLRRHGFDVRAVASRSAETAAAFAAEFDIPNVHVGYEALAADPEVDVIYIATPHPFHAEQAVLALDAGKHVLIEKPFTLNAAEAQAVVALAAERGLVVLEAMWTRFLPHMVRLRELLADGVIGQPRSLVADHTQLLSDDPEHRMNNLELGGGALLDLGVYPVSFASSVFGTPTTIQATAALRDTGADMQVATLFGYAGGQVANTLSASNTVGPNRAAIVGTDGWIEFERVWYTATTFRVFGTDGEVVETYRSEVDGRGMHFQAWELERLASEGRLSGDIMPLAETVAIMETLDEVRRQIGVRYPGE